jgi:hypothetical protein
LANRARIYADRTEYPDQGSAARSTEAKRIADLNTVTVAAAFQ